MKRVFSILVVTMVICLLDPVNYFEGLLGTNDNVIPVGSWLGIPFFDHFLNSSAYMDIINGLGNYFLELYVTGATM